MHYGIPLPRTSNHRKIGAYLHLLLAVLLALAPLLLQPSQAHAAGGLIEDAALESVIREELGKSSGALTESDLLKLTEIYAYQDEGIVSLNGLEHAKNLQKLILRGQPVSDLAPIENLVQLTFVDIAGTEVTDLKALSKLERLTHLDGSGTSISDLSPLAGLTDLTELFVAETYVSTLEPVKDLPLVWLDASDAELVSIAPLRGKEDTLRNVFLSNNQIEDATLLIRYYQSDYLYIDGNPLNYNSLQVLRKLETVIPDLLYDDEITPGSVSVVIDGSALVTGEQGPLLIGSTTFVPMRAIFEALGATITWDAETRSVTGQKGDAKVWLQIGSKLAQVNGKELALDEAPQLVNDTTVVPVRVISEGLGASVGWDADTWTVTIRTK